MHNEDGEKKKTKMYISAMENNTSENNASKIFNSPSLQNVMPVIYKWKAIFLRTVSKYYDKSHKRV